MTTTTSLPLHLEVLQEKKHVSYSELALWQKCSFRHRLKYLLKVDLDKPSIHAIYGKTVHDALEQYLESRQFPEIEEIVTALDNQLAEAKIEVNDKVRKEFHDTIAPILSEIPEFLETEFKDWEFIAAEQALYEEISEKDNKFSFKGFIDGIIKIPRSSRYKRFKEGEYEYWIIDYKTCSWGWDFKKKTDPIKIEQLALYKHFWAKKLNVSPDQIKCAFVLLKRTPSKNSPSRIELVTTSVGPKTIEKALEALKTMTRSITKGLVSKNRNECTYCEYKNTEHCP